MKIVLFLMSVFFLSAFGYNLYVHNPDAAVIQLILGIVMLLYGLFLHKEDRKRERFLAWVYTHNEQLRTEAMNYEGAIIDHNTKFVQYQCCLSIWVFSFRRSSSYYIVEHHYTPLISIMFTLLSCLFGWWGIPWGPIYTIGAIKNNIFSKKIELSTLINMTRDIDIEEGKVAALKI